MAPLLSPEEQKRLVDGLLKEAASLKERIGNTFYERLLDLTGTRYQGNSHLKDALQTGMAMAFKDGFGGRGDAPFTRFLSGLRQEIVEARHGRCNATAPNAGHMWASLKIRGNTALYGFWSDEAVHRVGTVVYTTPQGCEVEVCFVDKSPTAEGYGYSDMKPMGEVCNFVRRTRPGMWDYADGHGGWERHRYVHFRMEKQIPADKWARKFKPYDSKAKGRGSRNFNGDTGRTGMDKRFKGFNTMAVALAAAGLGVAAPVAAAAVVAAEATKKLKFILLSRDGWKVWVRDLGDGFYQGPLSDYMREIDRPYNRVLETLYADSWADIPFEERKKQTAWVEGGDAGWLDREGNFYSCNYGGHSALSREVLYKEYDELEAAGWVHVDQAPQKGCYTFRYVNHNRTLDGMSPQQIAWLKQRGHDLNPHNKPEEAIKLGEYEISAGADAEAFDRQMRKAGLNPDDFRKPQAQQSKSRLAAFR